MVRGGEESNWTPNRPQTQSPPPTLASSPKTPKRRHSSSPKKATSTLELDQYG